jgi:hypothetical protein
MRSGKRLDFNLFQFPVFLIPIRSGKHSGKLAIFGRKQFNKMLLTATRQTFVNGWKQSQIEQLLPSNTTATM